MKTTLLNPVQYDEAIMELLRNNKQSESLQLAKLHTQTMRNGLPLSRNLKMRE